MPEKLKMHSMDLVARNIDLITEFFPSCKTEAALRNGQLKHAVDWDALKQELSEETVEGPLEKYHLNWPGKHEAKLAANAPIAKTLRPCREESERFDTTENLFIEGDNLEALKLLQESYLGQIKLIYVDPPYNTGNDFVYEDDFSERSERYLLRSNQTSSTGERLVTNTAANGRFHSDWLSMLYPRLKLAKNLLSDNGVIAISIDDNEVHKVRMVCDELFGIDNFLAEFVWKCRQFTDARSKDKISTDHEYIVCYSKSNTTAFRGNPRDETKYTNPDNDERGPWMSRSILGLATRDQRPNLHFPLVEPETGRSFDPPANTGWRYSKARMDSLIEEGCILFPESDDGRPREKKFRADLQSEFTSFPTIIDDVYTSAGTAEVRELFGEQVFDFPKPTELLKRLIQQTTGDGDLVLDMFAGSASTAHAVFKLNASDGNRRRFVMLQMAEPTGESSNARAAGFETISSLAIERIRRCGQTLANGLLGSRDLDCGFRMLKIDTSNMKDVYYSPSNTDQAMLAGLVDNIKNDRSGEDLLFQVLLDCGVDLALPVSAIGMEEHCVYFVNDSEHANPDLIACFDADISESLVKAIAGHQPLRAVFRDHCFSTDDVKINVEQIFKQMSPQTQLKSL